MFCAPLGILIIGRHIAADNSTVWRNHLDRLLKSVIKVTLPNGQRLPITTDFPMTPYICSNPRPPMRFVIQLYQYEYPQNVAKVTALLEPVAAALTAWIRDSRSKDDSSPVPSLLIELEWRGGTSQRYSYSVD